MNSNNMSPFVVAKSVLSTKEYLYDVPSVMDKDYNAFMINRILSNSAQTALFADVINQYSILDKKLQYDFYFYGCPKQRANSKWIKKEDKDTSQEYVEYICSTMNVSLPRGIEIYNMLGQDCIKEQMKLIGGKTSVK